ncbi:MAG: cupin domain-containing protein [Desulfobacterales bacterium]|nr:cupin domain-containing protein [Desulfobacterales bacterium]
MKTEKIGQRIKKFMKKAEMTIDELAGRTGLSSDFIRSVQEEDVYPSLGPLLKIARALGVRLGTFLDDQVSQDPLIIRKNERKDEMSMLRAKDKPVALKFYSLGRGKSDRHMEPFFIEIMPESAKEKKVSSHEGEEFIVVLSGRITVTYGQETYDLETGDSIYYNSIVPHYVSCKGDEKATIHAVLYIPE